MSPSSNSTGVAPSDTALCIIDAIEPRCERNVRCLGCEQLEWTASLSVKGGLADTSNQLFAVNKLSRLKELTPAQNAIVIVGHIS